MGSDYRDDRDALRARAENLEDEIAAKDAELERLRAAAPPEELTHKLEVAQHKIEQLEAELHPQRVARRAAKAPFVAAALAIGAAVLGAGLALRTPSREPVVVKVPLPRFTAESPPEPEPPPHPAPPPPRDEPTPEPVKTAASIDGVWKGKVKSATGIRLAAGAPCRIAATMAGATQPRIAALTVTCAGQLLFTREGQRQGWWMNNQQVLEEASEAGFRRSLRYEDTYVGSDRGAENSVAIDTTTLAARVFSGGANPVEVRLVVDELDAPTRDPLLTKTLAEPNCMRSSTTAKVTEVSGDAKVTRGAVCDVKLRPFDDKCQVRIACGPTVLYPGRLARLVGTEIIDEDGDGEGLGLRIQGKLVDVSRKSTSTWSARLELAKPQP